MVVKMRPGLLHSASSREQKKLAPSILRLLQFSATVLAIVVFPVPADPLIQNMREFSVVIGLVLGLPDDSSETKVS